MTNTDSAATSVGAARAVGRSDVQDAVMNLERLVQDLVEARVVPGLSLAVVHRDEEVHLAGYGRTEIDDERRVSARTQCFSRRRCRSRWPPPWQRPLSATWIQKSSLFPR